MFNEQLVADHTQLIRISAARLESLAALPWEEFMANPDNFAIAEHLLANMAEKVKTPFLIGQMLEEEA